MPYLLRGEAENALTPVLRKREAKEPMQLWVDMFDASGSAPVHAGSPNGGGMRQPDARLAAGCYQNFIGRLAKHTLT